MPRVLIADDEESMRTLVARAIAMDGHATVTAEDGAEALEILNREAGAFDLLADRYPDAGDGRYRAGADRRARFSRTDDSVDDRLCRSARARHGLNAIVHDVITKPFSVADIRAAVAAALAARKG